MKIVIDIPDIIYSAIQSNKFMLDEYSEDIIKNGKPLPKGHGRLIDENQLVAEIRDDIVRNFDNLEWWLSAADTIIEAESEDKD